MMYADLIPLAATVGDRPPPRPTRPMGRPPARSGKPGPERGLDGWVVLVRMTDEAEVAQVRSWVEEMGGEAISVSDTVLVAQYLQGRPGAPVMVVIERDDREDPDMLIEDCLVLRNLRPDVPILIVSHKLSVNDFSAERLVICDTSLKTPITRTAFCLGIETGIRNNDTYMKRFLSELPVSLRPQPLGPAPRRAQLPALADAGNHPERRFPSGWWLLPSIVGGLTIYGWIIAAIIG